MVYDPSLLPLATLGNPAWYRTPLFGALLWWERQRNWLPPEPFDYCNLYVLARRSGAPLYAGRSGNISSSCPSGAWRRVLQHCAGDGAIGWFILGHWALALRLDVYLGRSDELFPFEPHRHNQPLADGSYGWLDSGGHRGEALLIEALRPRFNRIGIPHREYRPPKPWMVPEPTATGKEEVWRRVAELGIDKWGGFNYTRPRTNETAPATDQSHEGQATGKNEASR